jgi:hypothetical protein
LVGVKTHGFADRNDAVLGSGKERKFEMVENDGG